MKSLNRTMVLFVLIVIIESFTPVFAVSFPDERPDIVSATAQKDKAAIVLIRTIISGKAQYPSFEIQFAGASGSIVGTWQHPNESFSFNADGTFHNWSINGQYDLYGTYSISGNQITLTYTGQAPVTGTYSIAGNTLTLSFPTAGITASYSRVGTAEQTDVVANAEAMQLVRIEGTSATIESSELQTGGSGTGFIVSPDGYIVTNAHVVFTGKDNENELLKALFGAIQSELIQEVSKYYNIPEEDKQKVVEILSQKFMAYFLQYGSFSGVTKNIYVVNGIPKPGEDLETKSWQAVVKKEGSIMDRVGEEWTWGRDVAVIKVNKSNLPTVRLGDSDKVEPGDKVFIIGYPDTGLDEFFEPTALMEPTVSQGVISARRTLKNGMETLQTDAAINHGNSGGPAYNNKGQVIGLATFGAGPEQGIEAIKFCMPINLAKEYLNELNVKNKKSALDEAYEQALEAFWARDCTTAITKFEEALTFYPDHPFAQEYINECRRVIQAGEVKSKQPEKGQQPVQADFVLPLVLGAVIAGGIVFYFFFRRTKAVSTTIKKETKEIGKKFCPRCGNRIESGEKFCPNCGTKL